jgi:hypothetical protein
LANRIAYPEHIEALRTVMQLLRLLPGDYKWGLSMTEADTADGQGIFNIYVKDEDARVRMRKLLNLGCILEEGDDYEVHRLTDTLYLNICEGD